MTGNVAKLVVVGHGGLATNERAEVLGERGPLPGLYAAGETTGHFYRSAPNAVSVLRALVFGQVAGRQAVDFLAMLKHPGFVHYFVQMENDHGL